MKTAQQLDGMQIENWRPLKKKSDNVTVTVDKL